MSAYTTGQCTVYVNTEAKDAFIRQYTGICTAFVLMCLIIVRSMLRIGLIECRHDASGIRLHALAAVWDQSDQLNRGFFV